MFLPVGSEKPGPFYNGCEMGSERTACKYDDRFWTFIVQGDFEFTYYYLGGWNSPRLPAVANGTWRIEKLFDYKLDGRIPVHHFTTN